MVNWVKLFFPLFLILLKASDIELEANDFDDEDDLSFPSVDEYPIEGNLPPDNRNPKQTVTPHKFTKPSSEGLLFLETFDEEGTFTRWIETQDDRFLGQWTTATRKEEGIKGDHGLRIQHEAKHHAIYTKLNNPPQQNKNLVVSYEVKFENDLQCGGAYMKLFDSKTLRKEDHKLFTNQTPYVIMFGPDKCGATNKVHLIVKKQNPKNNIWMEHHVKNPPRVPSGTDSHTYGFQITTDDHFSIFIDGKEILQGSLNDDFEPPFTPPKKMADEIDKKPADWDDNEEVSDPFAIKPDDWDETQPKSIPDPNSVKPEGWLDDIPKMVVDESVKKPEVWNDEEDGGWLAPLIANPLCVAAVGCGVWAPRMISNPLYRGKWTAALIPNSNYKGVWEPREIDNPFFFEDLSPHQIAAVDSIGIEIWTMQAGIIFDNFAVAHDWVPVKALVEATWGKRYEIETSFASAKIEETAKKIQHAQSSSYLELLFRFLAEQKGIVVSALVVAVTAGVSFRRRQRARQVARAPDPAKPTPDPAKPTPDPAKTAREAEKPSDESENENEITTNISETVLSSACTQTNPATYPKTTMPATKSSTSKTSTTLECTLPTHSGKDS